MGHWMKDSEGINQRTRMHGPWIWTMMWGLTEGEKSVGWVEVGKGRKIGNNRNCINNRKDKKRIWKEGTAKETVQW